MEGFWGGVRALKYDACASNQAPWNSPPDLPDQADPPETAAANAHNTNMQHKRTQHTRTHFPAWVISSLGTMGLGNFIPGRDGFLGRSAWKTKRAWRGGSGGFLWPSNLKSLRWNANESKPQKCCGRTHTQNTSRKQQTQPRHHGNKNCRPTSQHGLAPWGQDYIYIYTCFFLGQATQRDSVNIYNGSDNLYMCVNSFKLQWIRTTLLFATKETME